MPWSDRWYYGDALYNVDPCIWLLAATGPFLSQTSRRSRLGHVVWGAGTAVLSALVFVVPSVPLPVKAAWTIWVAALWTLRWRGLRVPALPQASVMALLLYVTVMLA